MTEQTRRLKRALHGRAERGISPTQEPWAEIEGRLEARTAAPTRRRFVPRTRTRLALVAALVVLFGMGAYAATDWAYKHFRSELPGARGPASGEQLSLVQTANGARVSLEWAYADSRNVVVGYNIKDLEGDRRVAGRPAELSSYDWLTDESGTDIPLIGGQRSSSGNRRPLEETPGSVVFAPRKALKPGNHEFQLKMHLVARALPDGNRSERVGEPLLFDFEIPVSPARIIETNQTVEASGVTLTLEHVVNSPARPEAEICYGSPDTDYDWAIYSDTFPQRLSGFGGGPEIGEKRACTTMLLTESPKGRSTVTVAELEGTPGCPPGDDNGCSIPRSRVETIEGPWTFKLTAPGG